MARKTGSVNHTHQYYRRPDGLWACSGIENCTHYMPKNMYPSPAGRMSLCWTCEKTFMLTPVNMEDGNPKCDACSEQLSTIDEWMNTKMKAVEEKNPFAKFKSANPLKVIMARAQERAEEKEEEDQIESYRDEEHAPECEFYVGKDCTCR